MRSGDDHKVFRDVTARARKDFFDRKIQNMTAAKRPWEGMRWIGPWRPPAFPSIRDRNDDPIKDPEALLQHMHRHFNSSVASRTVNWRFIHSLPAEEERPSPPISAAEILEALSSTSNSSAPGSDHITWRHLKLVIKDEKALHALATLFNRVINEGVWLHQLKDAVSCIIPKPKKPAYDVPKAFRPIALLNTISKLLTKVIAKRMQFEAQEHNLFHDGQFGGISRHSTTDVGLVLMDLITENRDRGLHTTVLALDVAQFFLSMSHEVVCALLAKLGFSSKIVRFLAAFLQDRSTTYTWDGITTDTHFQCSDGVPQGDPLSPVLSALYLSLVIKRLFPWSYERWINSLFFVDDGTLVCSSPSLEDNVSTLSLFYKHFLHLLANIGLTVEQSKLELKHFIAFSLKGSHRSFDNIPQPPLRYNWRGKDYEVQPSKIWQYLGFFFDSFLRFDFHVQYYTNKGFSTIRACNMLGSSCSGLGPKQRVVCYNAYVVSVLTYGLPLWYAENGAGVLKNFRKMARVQNYAVCWITGGFRGTPIGAMELLSGVPPLRLRCNLMLAGYVARIHTLPGNHLLKRAWGQDTLPTRLPHFRPRRRPRHLPSDNPLERLRRGKVIHEQFNEFNPANRPGCRVVDLFPTWFNYLHLDTPRKGSDGFKDWMTAFKGWIRQMEMEGQWMIYTDGGFWKNDKRGTHAMVATRGGHVIAKEAGWVPAASSFDSELAALLNAISWVVDNSALIASPDIYFLIDNKSIIQSFLQMHIRSSQMTSLRINLLLADLLTRRPDLTLHFSHCPSHSKVPFNEAADQLASTFVNKGGGPDVLLRQHFLDDESRKASKHWQALSHFTSYRGKSWMKIKRRKKPFTPSLKNKDAKHFFINLANNDMKTMLRITWAVTAHAPIGEYYLTRPDRFLGFPYHCPAPEHDAPIPQTRKHVFVSCYKYVLSFSSLHHWSTLPNNDEVLSLYLRNNPSAFTFDDLPRDVH